MNQAAKKQEVATVDDTALATQTEPSPLAIIQQAVASGSNPDTLAKLMDLQERWQANAARQAFTAALNAFKANPPSIFKNKHVGFESRRTGEQTDYWHATLDHVCTVLNDALTKHDLSFRWETDNGTEGLIRVTCVLTHEMGHSERTMLQATPDTSGKKNPIQAIGSTVTYLQRYTLLAATGMAVQGQDDDGRGAANNDDGPVTPQQARDIHEELGKAGLDAGPVCDWRSVETVEDIKAADYDRVISAIRQKGAAK